MKLATALVLPLVVVVVAAQSSATASSSLSTAALATTTASSSSIAASVPSGSALPTIVPSTPFYTYIGCYNETTGNDAAGNVRALAGGNTTTSPQMSINYCLSFCGTQMYAGLEYSKECWCAPYINTNSMKLGDGNCSLPCAGDPTEACGAALKLTMYQYQPSNKATSEAHRLSVLSGWELLALVGVLGYVTR